MIFKFFWVITVFIETKYISINWMLVWNIKKKKKKYELTKKNGQQVEEIDKIYVLITIIKKQKNFFTCHLKMSKEIKYIKYTRYSNDLKILRDHKKKVSKFICSISFCSKKEKESWQRKLNFYSKIIAFKKNRTWTIRVHRRIGPLSHGRCLECSRFLTAQESTELIEDVF